MNRQRQAQVVTQAQEGAWGQAGAWGYRCVQRTKCLGIHVYQSSYFVLEQQLLIMYAYNRTRLNSTCDKKTNKYRLETKTEQPFSQDTACSHACVHAPCLCPWAMPNACPCRCPRNFKYLWLPVPLLLLTTFVLFILFVAIYVCFLIYSLNMPLAYRVLTPVRKRIRSIPGKVALLPRGSLLHRYSVW